MHVFVTGASGFVGSGVVRELIDAGHRVTGLAPNEAEAATIEALGATVHRGDLEDPDSLRRGASTADGVIHTAFIHDFSRYQEAGQIDERAVDALGSALEGSDRPLIITSVIMLLAPGGHRTEADSPAPGSAAAARIASEEMAISFATRGVRSAAVRLPPFVHGEGDRRGFVPALVDIARKKGASAYIGDGSNRWCAVHRLDAAQLFRLALEGAPAGTVLHGIADEGVQMREAADVIGRQLGVPVSSVTPEEANDHFGLAAQFVAVDIPASSSATQELTGWRPTHPDLIADLRQGHYFQAPETRNAPT